MLTEDKPVQVVLSEIFLKDIKDLAKSYRSVRKDILPLIERLSDAEIIGDRLKGFDYDWIVKLDRRLLFRSSRRRASF